MILQAEISFINNNLIIFALTQKLIAATYRLYVNLMVVVAI